MLKNSKILSLLLHQPWWRLAAGAGVILVGLYFLKVSGKPKDFGPTFAVKRGPLDITVMEGGSIESEEKGEIKCEVKGGQQGVKILKIVPEGYLATSDDVKTNKVLVELDSADLRKQITQQEITFGSTAASLIDAQQAYEIQLNQNQSDVLAAIQKAGFNRMDFDKYMGDQAAREIITQLGIKTELTEEAAPRTNLLEKTSLERSPASQGQKDPPAQPPTPNQDATNAAPATNPASVVLAGPLAIPGPMAIRLTPSTNGAATSAQIVPVALSSVVFAKYANLDLLGDGEAKQKLRDLQDAVQVAGKEIRQSQATLAGTKRLFEKKFVTKIELDRDQLIYDNSELKVKKVETALDLFKKYEFPKAAQEALSKYAESLRELDRTRKGAVSKLAQADAKLKSAQAKYNLEERQLKELYEQIEKCSITAPRPGLVVYGAGGEVRYWRNEEQIREGATVREGQTVVTIPDMRKLCIKVKIHEATIKKILKGQKARLTADAFPDRKLDGEVSQVGVLPDSENSWLNPDMKVYRTTVAIHGEHEWIKPGMSTKVAIMVNQLTNVVYVPIQAVNPQEDKKVCYVIEKGGLKTREVEVGEFNEEFIEIKKGLKDGEKVCLHPPASTEEQGSGLATTAKEESTPANKGATTAAGSGK